MAAERQRCRTAQECFEAGRQNAREKGWKLSPAKAAQVAAMIRPYLRRDETAA